MDETISMDGVDAVYSGYGLPTVRQLSLVAATVDDLLREEHVEDGEEVDARWALQALRCQVVQMGLGLRKKREMGSPLEVLLRADRLSLGQIAGRLRADPLDIEVPLRDLIKAGVVHEDSTGPMPRYSIVGLLGE